MTKNENFLELTKNITLVEWVMDYLTRKNMRPFTGHVNIEIHIKDDEVVDIYVNPRDKLLI